LNSLVCVASMASGGTPQDHIPRNINGLVERKSQTSVEMSRNLMKGMSVLPKFWSETVKSVVHPSGA
jgi:hypothetical protein